MQLQSFPALLFSIWRISENKLSMHKYGKEATCQPSNIFGATSRPVTIDSQSPEANKSFKILATYKCHLGPCKL
jgi:hypothetical protein